MADSVRQCGRGTIGGSVEKIYIIMADTNHAVDENPIPKRNISVIKNKYRRSEAYREIKREQRKVTNL
jgi:hypothetical protein